MTGVLIAVGAATIVAPAAWANLAQVGVKTQPNPIREVAPAVSAGYFSWAQTSAAHPNTPNVYEQVMSSGSPSGTATKVNVTGSLGWAGGISSTRLAYQQVINNQSDIRFYNLALHQHSNPPVGVNSSAWEYSPTLTSTWLMFGRGGGGSSRVLLFNLQTKSIRVLATVNDNSAGTAVALPGQVNGNYAAYATCQANPTGCHVYLYDIANKTTVVVPRSAGLDDTSVAVSATGTLYWDRESNTGCGNSVNLMKLPLGGSSTSILTLNTGNDLNFLQTYNDGSNDQVFYERIACATNGNDIYRVAAP